MDQLNKKLTRLGNLAFQTRTKNQLNQCLELLNEVKDIISCHFDTINQSEIRKHLEEVSKDVIFCFKFNHLVDLIFDAGAYCIFKKRYDYLYKLWTFRQPGDADAIWIGHDIVPSSLPVLFDFYFRISSVERSFFLSWEDHHGSSRYYDQYFLILLLREFLNSQVITNQARQNLINNFRIPTDFSSIRLRNVHFEVDRLVTLASELNNFSEPLGILGFDTDQLSDAIQHGLLPFLEELKVRTDQQIEQQMRVGSVSSSKIDEFKSDFLKGYEKRVSLRHLFQFLNLYEDKTNELGDENIFSFGFNNLEDKSMFFNEWYVDYGHPGGNLGRILARDEDSILIVKIAQACQTLQNVNLESILANFKDNINNLIIIGVNISFGMLFMTSNKFKRKEEDKGLGFEPPNFLGSYNYAENEIPVFEYICTIPMEVGIPDKAILLLDKTQLGRLIQYAPKARDEPYQMEQHFAFSIAAFSESAALIDEFLQSPQDWLLSTGDEAQQRTFLESKVLVKIYEKFDLVLDPNFVGFIVPTENTGMNLEDFEIK